MASSSAAVGPPAFEPQCIAALAVGPLVASSWDDPARPADFFTLKGVLEALGSQLGTTVDVLPREMPFLHPGRSAAVELGGLEAGWLGEVHPARLPRSGTSTPRSASRSSSPS